LAKVRVQPIQVFAAVSVVVHPRGSGAGSGWGGIDYGLEMA